MSGIEMEEVCSIVDSVGVFVGCERVAEADWLAIDYTVDLGLDLVQLCCVQKSRGRNDILHPSNGAPVSYVSGQYTITVFEDNFH